MTTRSLFVDVEGGARLYVEVTGQGPALLVMGGIGSGAFTDAEVIDEIAARHTMITYDRRGTFRSTFRDEADLERDLDPAEQARDALAVLAAAGVRSASVVATCGAAAIALELLIRHPDAVEAMLVHEPVTVNALPTADEEAAPIQALIQVALKDPVAAMGAFLTAHDLPFPPAFQESLGRQGRYCAQREAMPMLMYRPDVAALVPHRDVLVMAAGDQSLARDFAFARIPRVLAEQIGCPFVVLPGNHTGYFQQPSAFAAATMDALARVSRR